MRQLEVDGQTALNHILGELKITPEDGLELTPLEGSKTILDNPINREIIKKVAATLKKEVVFPTALKEEAPLVDTDSLGFVEGEDVIAKLPMQEVPKLHPQASAETEKVSSKKSFSIPNLKILKSKPALIAAVIMLLIGAFFIGFLFLPQAQVTITLASSDSDSEVTLVAGESITTVDAESKKIPLTTQEVSKEGSDQLATTTKKTIGSTATGRVTITNQDTTTGKTFLASSTTLTPNSGGGVTFRIANDVSLDPAPFGGSSSAGVNVVANQVGQEGNLEAATLFKINGQSNFVFAKNDAAFSGGESKQITVATSDDRELLKNKLVNKLTEEAETELTSSGDDSIVIDDASETKVAKESYTPKDLTTETSTLKATVGVKTTAKLVKKSDLLDVLTNKIEKEKEGYKVDKENSTVTATLVSKNPDGTLSINAEIKSKLVAQLNESDITQEIKGKSLSDVGRYLDSLEDVGGYKVTTNPSIFRIFGRLPFFTKQIKVQFEKP